MTGASQPDAIQIVRLDTPGDPHWAALRELLRAYNRAAIGEVGASATLAFGLQDERGEAVKGGFWGEIYWNWLSVYLLVVPDEQRRTGIGSRLLHAAERFAREQGCIGALLDTFSFQAPDFYFKHGYEAFGELPGYPDGHSRLFLRKRWTEPGPQPDRRSA